MLSYRMRKLKHLTVQSADESVEYTIKGTSIQYELLECAIKGKYQCNMNSEYSNSEPIKLSKSSYTILCHKIIYKYLFETVKFSLSFFKRLSLYVMSFIICAVIHGLVLSLSLFLMTLSFGK